MADFSLLKKLCSVYTPHGYENLLVPVLEKELASMGAQVRVIPLTVPASDTALQAGAKMATANTAPAIMESSTNQSGESRSGSGQGDLILPKETPGRSNILALWGNPKVMFSTHLDVVPPDLPVVDEGHVFRGRGACDAKGQIAAQLAAIKILLAEGFVDIAWLGVSGEETDSCGAFASRMLYFEDLQALIVGEPTGRMLARGQKAFYALMLECTGTTAHGGKPELGCNAIYSLCDWIIRIRNAQYSQHPQLGKEAMNVGLISGGRAANVVADYAQATLTVRGVPDGSIFDEIYRTAPENGKVRILLQESAEFFDVPQGFPSTDVFFGSDLGTMRAIAPKAHAILAGPGRIEVAHTPFEELRLDELEEGIKLYCELGKFYLGNFRGGVT